MITEPQKTNSLFPVALANKDSTEELIKSLTADSNVKVVNKEDSCYLVLLITHREGRSDQNLSDLNIKNHRPCVTFKYEQTELASLRTSGYFFTLLFSGCYITRSVSHS